jgi:P27 family predicted phage terminase small subunit
MPTGLSDDAKALWKNYSAQLHSLGVLTTNDATALLLLVNAHVSYLTLETEIATHGHMIRGRMGEMVRNPAVAMRNDAWKRLLKILQEFGMSPSSRTRISAIPASPESDDDRFFS